jgi:hypothetical protein
VPGEGVTDGATSADPTKTVAAVEFAAAPVLSVTWSMKLQLPVAVEVEVTKL